MGRSAHKAWAFSALCAGTLGLTWGCDTSSSGSSSSYSTKSDDAPFVTVELGQPGTATIQWTTEEPARFAVHFGTDPGALEGVVVEKEAATEHAVLLTGLELGATYDVALASANEPDAAPANVASFHVVDQTLGAAAVSGSHVAWQPITLSFEGPWMSEGDYDPNPFLDYRLDVTFTGPSGQVMTMPGFFDGDGMGGGTGNVYSVRFAAEEAGVWSYTVGFWSGKEVAVADDPSAFTAIAPHGQSGTLSIAPTDPNAPGFYKYGVLECTKTHYLKFREGPYFLKGGTDSPENFLGYRGFDNTFDQSGGASTSGMADGVHRYAPHVADFGPNGLGDVDDPYWVSADTGYDSKGIIGALNYLSSVGVNSIYFLPMNLGGDGRETYPFVDPGPNDWAKTHYDISKLWQWNQTFVHAQKRGILLHFVLGETESGNEQWLDGGTLGVQRKLFYREMIGRFSHALAIKWNLSEENDFSTSQIIAFAKYIEKLDPFHRPVAFHTHVLGSSGNYPDYDAVLGNSMIGATSIQGDPEDAGYQVEKWRQKSAAAGHPWVVETDEQTPASTGLTDSNIDQLRKETLWDVYLSGGGIEWYAGYHPLPLGGDMRLEDFRTREKMWIYMDIARRFVEHMPFWLMQPADGLIAGESAAFGGAEVFAKHDTVYAVYYPSATSTGTIDLTGTTPGDFNARWFDPREGAFTERFAIPGAGVRSVGPPPYAASEDWVLYLRR